MPVEQVAKVLGHQDVKLTLKHYTDLRTSDLDASLSKRPPLPRSAPQTDEPQKVTAGAENGSKPASTPEPAPKRRRRVRTQRKAREGASGNGPSRTRTWDLAIMSRLL